ncbi:MAG: hypothetical protein Q7J28_13315 [Caulobacter sp.]|nr:hypothetical protein [Caulobacter sp.]
MRTFVTAGLMTFLLAAGAFAQPSAKLAFQGLDGRSAQADVLKKFPQATRENDCAAGETVSRRADGDVACESLVLDAYEVDGVDFKARFLFSIEGKIRYVSLLRQYGSPLRELPGVKREEIASRFSSLADLLSTKYGSAVADPPGSLLGVGRRVGDLEWQPGRGTKWMSGGDRISLSADAYEKRTSPGTYWGSVHIFYVFGRSGEADRL